MKRIGIYEGNRGDMFFYIIPHDRARHSESRLVPGFSIDSSTMELYLEKFFKSHFDSKMRINRNRYDHSSFYSIEDFRNLLKDLDMERAFVRKCYRNITGHNPEKKSRVSMMRFDRRSDNEESSQIVSYTESLEAIVEFYERFVMISEEMLDKDEKAPYIMVRRN